MYFLWSKPALRLEFGGFRVRHCVILVNLLSHSKPHFKRWEGDIFTEA